ncbi:hypothetical protein A1O7_08002 [Cladophialophora yegresii CBS 114405]|uniref:DNA mismatch repair protein MSH5 n=1 Tax=Cladophialophora yegresii CBS 114405 TaxID=1182544 RepID=W9VHF1_9EURO|nr:uncharacterized protein A1O7_08002 [Cladophialophora yegresii CBS 114405]EXJ55077.1 hypothetical protein A1O7_08002 [Cladophialophora yegresii CBS 114405]
MSSSRTSSLSCRGMRGRGRGAKCRGGWRKYGLGRNQPYQHSITLRTPSVTPPHISSVRYATITPSTSFVQDDQSGFQPRDDDFLEQVVMAVDIKEGGKVGCACFIAGEERLLCMEEVIGGGSEIVERLKLDLQPTTVILSPRSGATADNANDRLGRNTSLVDGDEGQPPLPYQIEMRPTPEFHYDAALTKLAGLRAFAEDSTAELLIPGESMLYEEDLQPEELGLTKGRGKLIQISAWLDVENKISIGCAGAIISHLQRRQATVYLPNGRDANQSFRVARLEMFSLNATMLINTDTLVSLQVFQPESQPNGFNLGPGTSGAKGSHSIYDLFLQHAKSPQGRAQLRKAFLRPSLEVDYINSRLDFISVFVRPENQSVRDKLSKSLGRIKNMRNTITLLHKGIDSGKAKQRFCYHAIDIAETLGEALRAERLPLCVSAANVLDRNSLKRIGRTVDDVVDRESSMDQHRTVVKRGINQELDKLKALYDSMEDLLVDKAREIQMQIPLELSLEINVTYIPHMGFHITIPRDSATGQAVFSGQDLGWQLIFTTSSQAYFKDETMNGLDNELGDLYSAICEMEVEIAYDLAQSILQDEDLLIAASDLCGELDCSLAFSHVAYHCKLTRPKITKENVIIIEGGRHLLQEMAVPSFVANDTYLVGGNGSDGTDGPNMLLLTGPNYSGKSVYQKQVALAVYMAQIGSFLPAEAATIGITDKILTRITTRETVSKVHSAFMIDMQQIAMALNSCTRRSLVVVDEFGKGTDTCDGAGLATGVFQHLLSLGTNAPKTLVATHFHEIFDLGVFENATNLSLAHMEVQVEPQHEQTAGKHHSEITYLYNLRPGRSNLSYGIQCAAMNGVPVEVVERAVELARLAQQGEDLVAICSALTEDAKEELEHAQNSAQIFVDQDFDRDWTKDELVATLDAMLEVVTATEINLSD